MTVAVVDPATRLETSELHPGVSRVQALWSWLPESATFLAVAWFLVVVARGWGGRDPHVVSIGLGLVFIAVALARPERVLPAKIVALAVSLSVAAVVVAAASPSGWAGAPGAARYVSAAWLALTVAAVVVRRPAALAAVAGLVVTAGAVEFVEGWYPWWAGQDPTRPMIGTFFWHNPYAAFLVPAALVGLVLWLRGTGALACLGLIGFALGTVGILYSTSRANMACLAAGGLLIGGLAVVCTARGRSAVRLVVAAAIAIGLSLFLAGPPFFPHRATAAGTLAARTAHESLRQNGGYRLEFWREAITVFWHHPIVGGGYHSMVAESADRVPSGWALSPYAHNGYLQAFSAGGLLLGIPMIVAAGGLLVIIVRLLVRSLRARELSVAGFALPLALGAVMAHSLVDFDWAYAANLAMAATLAGATVGWWLCARSGSRTVRRPPRRLVWALPITAAGCLIAVAVGGWHGDPTQNLPVNDQVSASPSSTR